MFIFVKVLVILLFLSFLLVFVVFKYYIVFYYFYFSLVLFILVNQVKTKWNCEMISVKFDFNMLL